MKRFYSIALTCVAALLISPSLGCQPSDSGGGTNGGSDAHFEGDGHDHGDEHAHPSHGPHGGSLIELGNEAYHAELVHDEASGSVSVYLLDSGIDKSVAIDSPSITINLSHDGNSEQFDLAAAPVEGDPEGKSSCFVSSDAELGDDLEDAHASAQLVVTIEGKQFRGTIAAHSH